MSLEGAVAQQKPLRASRRKTVLHWAAALVQAMRVELEAEAKWSRIFREVCGPEEKAEYGLTKTMLQQSKSVFLNLFFYQLFQPSLTLS